MATLPANVSELSTAEKYDLLDALWEDIEAHPSSVTAAQADELDRRLADYKKDRSSVIPWEQVKNRHSGR